MKEKSKNEKMYIVMITIFSVLLIMKSLFLDEYNPKIEEEKIVFNEYSEKYMSDNNFFKTERIIKIEELNHDDVNQSEEQLKYNYKIKTRYYLLWIMPYWEKSNYIYK